MFLPIQYIIAKIANVKKTKGLRTQYKSLILIQYITIIIDFLNSDKRLTLLF